MKKQIKSSVLNHCYQRAENGILLFYCISDYLIYFTHYCIRARRYKISVLALTLMPDHVHESVIAEKDSRYPYLRRDSMRSLPGFIMRYAIRRDNCLKSPMASPPRLAEKQREQT